MVKNLIKKILGKEKTRDVSYFLRYFLDKKEMKKILGKNKNGKQLIFPKRIAIIFIGTNKYIHFFPRYYQTIKKLFLPKTKKDFFVFTDQLDFSFIRGKGDVIIVPIKHEKFPFINLHKFKFINLASDNLKNYSQVIYLDADMYATSLTTEKDFFCHKKPLFAVQHFNFVKKSGEKQFENNPKSLASVHQGDDLSTYWQACFWGGESKEFLKVIKKLEKDTEGDLKNNIVARWWDESFLNKYLIDQKEDVFTYDPSYAYPLLMPIPKPFKKRIIHVDENPPDMGGKALKSEIRKERIA